MRLTKGKNRNGLLCNRPDKDIVAIRSEKRIAFFMENLILLGYRTVIIYRCASYGKGGGHVSDDELIDRIKGGDEAAAEQLIDRYYAAILRYCGWHCAAPEKAEDLTQETFLKLFRSLPRYKGRNKFKAYLYTIANRLCIDESRKMPLYALEDAAKIADRKNELAQAEHREDIRHLLCVLSVEQREAVILRFGQELSFSEIANVMGCSMRTAQSRVRNALQLMKRECGDEK